MEGLDWAHGHGCYSNKWVCQNTKSLSLCSVILNEVKNLKTSTSAFRILRFAQGDNLIEEIYFDTPTFKYLLKSSSISLIISLSR